MKVLKVTELCASKCLKGWIVGYIYFNTHTQLQPLNLERTALTSGAEKYLLGPHLPPSHLTLKDAHELLASLPHTLPYHLPFQLPTSIFYVECLPHAHFGFSMSSWGFQCHLSWEAFLGHLAYWKVWAFPDLLKPAVCFLVFAIICLQVASSSTHQEQRLSLSCLNPSITLARGPGILLDVSEHLNKMFQRST